MFLRSASCILVMLPALWLGGCTDTITVGQPIKRFTELVRGYDHTLTKDERKAAITELQEAKARQQEQAGQDAADGKKD